MVVTLLELHDLEILQAKDGNEAVSVLQENPDIDIILMDMMMPDVNGYEAMEIIRGDERFVELPIIAVTARAMPGDRERCISSGASDYITKPVRADMLMSVMRTWLLER